MMIFKYIIFAALFFNINMINAQDPELIGVTWHLKNLILGGQNFPPPVNEEVQNVNARFYAIASGDNSDFFDTYVCNNLNGFAAYGADNETFSFPQPLETTFILCNLQVNEDYESIYFGFYDDGPGNIFNYVIITDTNGNKVLTVTNVFGDQAIYGDYLLSREDFHKSNFAIHPNPVKNELFLNSNNIIGNIYLKIFNIEEKLLSVQNVELKNQISIDVSQLSSGLYFLNIEDENGNTAIKKFLKK